jgi:exopolyphosphatase/guanosine-5'-triphosphate,3'-diphosphate pyrophosphatase
VATAGLRGASNAEELVARAQAELGLRIEIIDGEREAELAFAAVRSRYEGPLTVVDIGGRSTEIVTGDVSGIRSRASLDLGGVRMTERHLPDPIPLPGQVEALRADIDRTLLAAPEPSGAIIGVSGTILAMMSFELGTDDLRETARRGEGELLRVETVIAAERALAMLPPERRVRGTAIPPMRADVIVAGAAIVLGVMRRYGAPAIRVSARELRHALLDVVDVERDDGEARLDQGVVE